jgi:hypothetical protein
LLVSLSALLLAPTLPSTTYAQPSRDWTLNPDINAKILSEDGSDVLVHYTFMNNTADVLWVPSLLGKEISLTGDLTDVPEVVFTSMALPGGSGLELPPGPTANVISVYFTAPNEPETDGNHGTVTWVPFIGGTGNIQDLTTGLIDNNGTFGGIDVTINDVPEPAPLTLLFSALLGLAVVCRRRRKAKA